ncbi:MAG: efflux RND transporter permease subunit [Rhodospirillaceae bacterium]
MVLSDISIRRPVVAIVISLLLVVFGAFAGMRLPVRETPDIDTPTIFVNVQYPGASAEVVETKVTKIVEQQIGSITGLKTIRSFARDGFAGFNLEFVIGHNLDEAANDIRDQLSRIINRLPVDAQPPVLQKMDADDEPIVTIAVYSDKRSQLEVADYLNINVLPQLATIPGVAAAELRNARQKSLRVWLDRRAMAAREITASDVEAALRRENVELGAGMLESAERNYTMRTMRTFRTPEDFANLVITRSATNNYLIRLGEIAKIEIGSVDDRSLFRQDGSLGTAIGVTKQPGASTLDVSEAIMAHVERLQQTMPSDFTVVASNDQADFIQRALHEVMIAFIVAGILVVGVIYLFLGTIRAALIPAVTVPISLIGTAIVLAPLGFSINILTLLAMVLAIGLVVDDAIIMLENIHRRMKIMQEPPLLAAFRGAKQVGTAILSTTMVLCAAFVPVMLMPGTIGKLFFEFAVTMAVAVAFSMFVSLTLTPVMCSKILTPDLDDSKVAHKAEEVFERLKNAYARTLDKVLDKPRIVFAAFGFVTLAVIVLFNVLPQEFQPKEDRGAIDVQIRSPEGATLAYTQKIVEQVAAAIKPIAEKGEIMRMIERVQSPGNEGGVSLRLVDWDERRSAQDIISEIAPAIAKIPGAQISPQLRGRSGRGGGGGNFISFSVSGQTFEELRDWRDKLMPALQKSPMIAQVRNNFIEAKPQVRIRIDQERAADLGVSVGAIGNTLASMMGSRRVTTFVDNGEEYDVLLQGSLEDRRTPTDVSNIYVRSDTTKELIPLASVVKLEEGTYAENLSRIDRKRAIQFFVNPRIDVKLSELVKEVEAIAEPILPQTAELVWRGEAQDFKETGYLIYISFGLALIVVFLVLAAQFESFIHPLVIMMTVPLAVFGALLGLALFGQSINIYSQVGIIVLVGLAAKNGILIVEFANQLRDAGRSFREALVEGAMTRLRPIIMTALATVMGAVPLMISTGAGSEGRRPLGVTIFTGVSFAAFVTLFVIPAFYMLIARNTGSPGRVAAELKDFERRHPLKGEEADELGHQPAE